MSFLSQGRRRRRRAGADAVSFWSGPGARGASRRAPSGRSASSRAAGSWPRRRDKKRRPSGLRAGAGHVHSPRCRAFAELFARVGHPRFGLTLDVGHLQCTNELPIGGHVARWKDVLWNVHVEDMRQGVHDHLMFGEGEIDFAAVFAALRERLRRRAATSS